MKGKMPLWEKKVQNEETVLKKEKRIIRYGSNLKEVPRIRKRRKTTTPKEKTTKKKTNEKMKEM